MLSDWKYIGLQYQKRDIVNTFYRNIGRNKRIFALVITRVCDIVALWNYY